MKRFRTGLLTALLSIVALSTHADRLYVENANVLAGGECNLNIVLESADMSQYCAFQFDLVLPQGVEIVNPNTINFYSNYFNDHEFAFYQLPSGVWRLVCYSPSNQPMKGQTGKVLLFYAAIGQDVAEGVHTGYIQNIVFTKLKSNGTTETVRMTASNYTITVMKPALDVTLATSSYVYNGTERKPAVTVKSGSQTLIAGTDYTMSYANNVNAGTATVTVVGKGMFDGITVQKTFTITKAPLTITAEDKTRQYGQQNPPLTWTHSGFVNGEGPNVLTKQPEVITTATVTSPVGTYPITASGAEAQNYNISYVQGVLTVTPVSSSLTFDNVYKSYGDAAFSVTPMTNVSGGAITYTSNNTAVVTVSGSLFTIVGTGTAIITANQAATANYSATSATFTVSVAKASLTISAGNYTKKQGDPMPQWKAEYSGFKYNDTEAVLTKQPEFYCDANAQTGPGTYTVTVSGAEAQNYNISYQPGVLTVTAAEQIIVTADNKSREYGDPNPELTWSVNGGTIQGTPQLICTAVANSPVNQYPIIVRQGTVTTPNVQFINGGLTVNKAPLTITAKSYTIKQGDPLPKFAVEYSGFKLNETASVLTQEPQLSCTAFNSSTPGEYPIYVYGAEAQNYSIQCVDGVLKIEAAATITVTIENSSREYGDPNPTQWKYSVSGGTLQGEPAFECDATQHSAVGQYEIRGSRGTVTNPNVQFVSGWLTVNKAPLKVIADSYTINQGDPLPEYTAHYEGFKLGETASVLTQEPQLICTAYDSSTPGDYPIYVYDAEAQNYSITFVDGVLTINEVIVEEKGYTLVVELTNGQKHLFVLKDRPQAWPQGSKLNIATATLSTSYERTDIKKFYFLDKDGNESGVKAAEVSSDLVVRQLGGGGLRISGLHDGETVRICDLSGRILLTEKAQDDCIELSLAQYPKGVYIVNINNRRTIKIQVR